MPKSIFFHFLKDYNDLVLRRRRKETKMGGGIPFPRLQFLWHSSVLLLRKKIYKPNIKINNLPPLFWIAIAAGCALCSPSPLRNKTRAPVLAFFNLSYNCEVEPSESWHFDLRAFIKTLGVGQISIGSSNKSFRTLILSKTILIHTVFWQQVHCHFSRVWPKTHRNCLGSFPGLCPLLLEPGPSIAEPDGRLLLQLRR